MSTSTLVTACCWRCGLLRDPAGRRDPGARRSPADDCTQCGSSWTPAREIREGHVEPGAGVVVATGARVWLARVIDIVVPFAMITAALTVAVVVDPGETAMGWLLAGATLAAGLEVHLLLRSGRTPGRWVAGLRTVDKNTGTPIGWERLIHRFIGGVPALGLVTADLRSGRDPVRADLTEGHSADQSVRTTVPPPPPELRPTTVQSAPPAPRTVTSRSAVLLVSESGRSWELRRPALVGRKPADPRLPDVDLIALPDLSRRLSRTHLLFERSDTMVWATDQHSTSGTKLITPDGTQIRLDAGARTVVPIGSVIECGHRQIRVLAHG
ncbi:MAG: RDD family protein [Propionibacteriales bacterium]|nr:RDD family protein [Propionibacteriales bacterium]